MRRRTTINKKKNSPFNVTESSRVPAIDSAVDLAGEISEDNSGSFRNNVRTARKLIKKQPHCARAYRKKVIQESKLIDDPRLKTFAAPEKPLIFQTEANTDMQTSAKKCQSKLQQHQLFQREHGFSPKICQGYRVYRLNSLNSIALVNGHIYDLLSDGASSDRRKKLTTCNCAHSKCQAGYCQCFSKGQKCKGECGCVSCLNKMSPLRELEIAFKGCKCEKSGCQKKYCQCLKQGMFCQDWCQCLNCMNRGLLNKKPLDLCLLKVPA